PRRHDRRLGLSAGAPRKRPDQPAGAGHGHALGRNPGARRAGIRAQHRGGAHLHAGFGGAAVGGARGHERRIAGAVFPRRGQFHLLRRAAIDHAQSRPRSGPRLDGQARPVADGGVLVMEGLGRDRPSWLEGLAHLWLPYAQMKTAPHPLAVARTEGCRIHLADGRVLIDGISSWWTACHGYNHPHISEAIQRQLKIMPHVMMAGLAHEPAATLARRLAALLPGELDHVFFSDSGSVAVEVALKMAVQFFSNRGQGKRTKFAYFKGGYHGDTLGAMAVSDVGTGMHNRLEGFRPTHHLACDLPGDDNAVAMLDRVFADEANADLAGIIVEPLVQGAGGMVFHPPEVLRRLRDLADRHHLLLIFD